MAYSKEYAEQLAALHKKESFGSGKTIPEQVKQILDTGEVKTFLDFGCGKGFTSAAIKEAYPDITVYSFDPVTSPIELPETVDMLYSSDVLEHIEPELLAETLADLFKRTSKYHYHLIACHLAKKALPDGRNAHLIIEEPSWWKQQLSVFKCDVLYEDTIQFLKTLKSGKELEIKKFITVLKVL